MATPPWIATFFFNREDNQFGFSENYYPVGPMESTARTACIALIPLRLDFMPPTWSIVHARLDVPGSPRDSIILPLPGVTAGTYDISINNFELPADTCVLATLLGDATHKNRHFLRPVLTQDTDGADSFAPSADYSSAFDAWAAALIAGFNVARYVKDQPTKTYFVPCVNASADRLTNRKCGRPFGLRRGRVR